MSVLVLLLFYPYFCLISKKVTQFFSPVPPQISMLATDFFCHFYLRFSNLVLLSFSFLYFPTFLSKIDRQAPILFFSLRYHFLFSLLLTFPPSLKALPTKTARCTVHLYWHDKVYIPFLLLLCHHNPPHS